MRIFITGATGVIGRRVVPLCLARGHEVTALARPSARRAALERLGARTVAVDLFDPDQVAAALAGHDAVVNLATHMPASMSRMLLPGAWRENDRIRREGSATLASAAVTAGVGRVVQESFAMVYPDHGNAWIDETMAIAPARYNRTVADAEHSAARFSELGGTGVVLRFAAFYGPDGRFFAELAHAIQRGFAPLFGPPDAYISSVSHHDAAAAVLAALQLPAGIYNVVDDEPLTHRRYVDSLADELGVRHPRLPPAWSAVLGGTPARVFARSLRISNRKLKDASTWTPLFPSAREGWPSAVAPLLAAPPRSALSPQP